MNQMGVHFFFNLIPHIDHPKKEKYLGQGLFSQMQSGSHSNPHEDRMSCNLDETIF